MKPSLWSVVLAAGSGRRLSSVTGGIPKQFWRFGGRASLLEETLTRLAPICPAERTVIVVNASQSEHVSQWRSGRYHARVVFQPEDRGTAAGVLFGLVPILVDDPDAIVLITPSDHGVTRPEAFRRGILDAVAHVQLHDGVVLFGVEPSAPQTDYGWITLGQSKVSSAVQPVVSFAEKPRVEVARRLHASGAVWNTMVIVARARALVDLCREHLPDLTSVFVGAVSFPPLTRDAFLVESYRHIQAADFSGAVLTPAVNLLAYTWPVTIGWTDLGTPERLYRWLEQTAAGKRPRLGSAAAAQRPGQVVAAT